MLCVMSFWAVGVIIVISTVTPLFLAFFFPLAIPYQIMQRYYVSSSRELKRLDGISRSPIYNHFTETLNGSITIRAFGATERFTTDNEQKLDTNTSAYYVFNTANRQKLFHYSLIYFDYSFI